LIYFKNQVNDELKVLWGYGQSLYEEQIPNVEIRYIEGLHRSGHSLPFIPKNLLKDKNLFKELKIFIKNIFNK
jgi:hypothetical protein